MNQELRNGIFKKNMLFNKYNKIRSRDNWEKYRTQRHLVNKIKRNSIREYFIERCVGGPKQKDFWPTTKPFITNKCSYFENNIILTDDDKILNDQIRVITKLPNSEQSYKGKVKTRKYINRQNQSTTGKL